MLKTTRYQNAWRTARSLASILSVVLLLTGLQGSHAQTSSPPVDRLYTFAVDDNTGFEFPGESQNGLTLASDGNFYGTNHRNRLFRVTPKGVVTPIHVFANVPVEDGSLPEGRVIQGRDGLLYGTTMYGGVYNYGIVYSVALDGSNYRILHSFGAVANDGLMAERGVIIASDGLVYGITTVGGTGDCYDSNHVYANGCGVIFRMATDGSAYSVIHVFTADGGDGGYPSGELLQASDGLIYGVNSYAGANGSGTIFRFAAGGAGYTVFYAFGSFSGDGSVPAGGLTQAKNGRFFGTTLFGGDQDYGTVYEFSIQTGTYSVVHSFAPVNDAALPSSELIQDLDGRLYGTTHAGGNASGGYGSVYSIRDDGSDYRLLYSFSSVTMSAPTGSVAADSSGNLFGLAGSAGANGYGGIFKLTTAGAVTFLSTFGTPGGSFNPHTPLLLGTDGALYGTTNGGGSPSLGAIIACGTIYRINADGTGFKQLYSFLNISSAICNPPGSLTMDGDGSLFGTTNFGGLTDDQANCSTEGCGVIFSFSPASGTFTAIHNLDDSIEEGQKPYGRLLLASDGKLYGTTSDGGSESAGVVFRVNADGTGYTVLHAFGSLASDGLHPKTGVIEAEDGNLYGVTTIGGTGDCFSLGEAISDNRGGCGTVFRMAKDGSGYLVLHSFISSATDDRPAEGLEPRVQLVQATDGRLYGATFYNATLFGINTDGSGFAELHTFPTNVYDSQETGAPVDAMIQGRDGYLYGTLPYGGADTCDSSGHQPCGALFKIAPSGDHYQQIAGFKQDEHGWTPLASLLQLPSGRMLGVALRGGGIPYSLAGTLFGIDTAPAIPSNVKAAASEGQVTLNWDAAAGASAYNLYKGRTSNGEDTAPIIAGVTTTSATVSGLPSGLTYFFKVTALNAAGETLGSQEVVATLPGAILLPTINIAVFPTQIEQGSSSTITWSTANAKTCTASGAWTGPEAVAGSQVVSPGAVGDVGYTLACENEGGQGSGTATLSVVPKSSGTGTTPLPPASGGSDGGTSSGGKSSGGGSFSPFQLLVLLLLFVCKDLRRRRPPLITAIIVGAGLPVAPGGI